MNSMAGVRKAPTNGVNGRARTFSPELDCSSNSVLKWFEISPFFFHDYWKQRRINFSALRPSASLRTSCVVIKRCASDRSQTKFFNTREPAPVQRENREVSNDRLMFLDVTLVDVRRHREQHLAKPVRRTSRMRVLSETPQIPASQRDAATCSHQINCERVCVQQTETFLDLPRSRDDFFKNAIATKKTGVTREHTVSPILIQQSEHLQSRSGDDRNSAAEHLGSGATRYFASAPHNVGGLG